MVDENTINPVSKSLQDKFIEEQSKGKVIVCDECSEEFKINTVDDIKDTEVVVHGERLFLKYFECPKCEHIYKINLDNSETMLVKKEYQNALERVQRNKAKHRPIDDKQLQRVEKLKRRYIDKCEKILIKHNVSFTKLATINK